VYNVCVYIYIIPIKNTPMASVVDEDDSPYTSLFLLYTLSPSLSLSLYIYIYFSRVHIASALYRGGVVCLILFFSRDNFYWPSINIYVVHIRRILCTTREYTYIRIVVSAWRFRKVCTTSRRQVVFAKHIPLITPPPPP